MKTLHQLLQGDERVTRGLIARRVGYFSSVALAFALLMAGLCAYGLAQRGEVVQSSGSWVHILPAVAMAYGSLLLLAVAIIEVRVRHVRADSLVLRARTLDQLIVHLTQCRETDRERISKWLHDRIAGRLTKLKAEIELLESSPKIGHADWKRLEETIANDLDEVRAMSVLLFPRIIGKLGLKAALKEMVARQQQSLELEITLDVTGDLDSIGRKDGSPRDCETRDGVSEYGKPETMDDVALCVYNVIQESLVNVQRHAGAGQARITLRRDAKSIAGSVCDDGRGSTNASEGMGLTLARERIGSLGGRFTAENSPKGGFRVAFEVPLRTELTIKK